MKEKRDDLGRFIKGISYGVKTQFKKGQRPKNFRGWFKSGKYVGLYVHGHPNSDKYGRILQHVYIMSQDIGRPLRQGECVHHVNGITTDNRIENLKLCHSHGQHSSTFHHEIFDRRVIPIDTKRLKEMIDDGKTKSEMAKEFSVSVWTIYRRIGQFI